MGVRGRTRNLTRISIYIVMNSVLQGDCLEVLKTLPENSVDSIVTDPPYELGFMGKSWDNTGIANDINLWKECLRVLKPGGHLLSFSGTRTYHRMASAIEDAGFEVRDMIEWVYSTGFPKSLNVWKQLKKNCTCGNMEVYERAEPKTKHYLRPLWEGYLQETKHFTKEQRKTLLTSLSEQNLSTEEKTRGCLLVPEGGEKSCLEGRCYLFQKEGELYKCALCQMPREVFTDGEKRWIYYGTQTDNGSTLKQNANEGGSSASHRPQSEQQQDREPCTFCKQWGTQATRTLGVGSALKPAHEPICMARKPLAEKTVAENCLKWGTGGINIDESRVEANYSDSERRTSKTGVGIWNQGNRRAKEEGEERHNEMGRFPANLIHDNSEEVRECFPETKQPSFRNGDRVSNNNGLVPWNKGRETGREVKGAGFTDTGNASRFFKSIIYQAKASKSERDRGCEDFPISRPDTRTSTGMGSFEQKGVLPGRNNHPTVKPIALMSYLIKMVTPKGGIVLDPFAGSGSTLVAAKQNGFNYIGIEKEEEYIKIIEARLSTPQETLF